MLASASSTISSVRLVDHLDRDVGRGVGRLQDALDGRAEDALVWLDHLLVEQLRRDFQLLGVAQLARRLYAKHGRRHHAVADHDFVRHLGREELVLLVRIAQRERLKVGLSVGLVAVSHDELARVGSPSKLALDVVANLVALLL